MSASKQKTPTSLKLSNLKEKKQIRDSMKTAFLVTLIQLEKTGSTGKIFIPLEI